MQGENDRITNAFLTSEDDSRNLGPLVSRRPLLERATLAQQGNGTLTCVQTLVAGAGSLQQTMARTRVMPFRSAPHKWVRERDWQRGGGLPAAAGRGGRTLAGQSRGCMRLSRCSVLSIWQGNAADVLWPLAPLAARRGSTTACASCARRVPAIQGSQAGAEPPLNCLQCQPMLVSPPTVLQTSEHP